jgi:hypothetical protein
VPVNSFSSSAVSVHHATVVGAMRDRTGRTSRARQRGRSLTTLCQPGAATVTGFYRTTTGFDVADAGPKRMLLLAATVHV